MMRAALVSAALALVVSGCGGGSTNFVGAPLTPPVQSQVAQPPVIDSITVTPPHAEWNKSAAIDATVHDTNTPLTDLRFVWSATLGSITGTGQSVSWSETRPLAQSPSQVSVTLTVSKQVPSDAGDSFQTLTTSQTVQFVVNDSIKELTDLVNTFLTDFTTYTASPDYCVRNFSDNCRGKKDELGDITQNRQIFQILSGQWSIKSINVSGASATIDAPCKFTSKVKATGQTEIASGDCILTGVYEVDRWYLCVSNFYGTSTDFLRAFSHP